MKTYRMTRMLVTMLVVLFGCLLPVLSGCSNVLGLPKSGAVQVIKPAEQDVRRIFTNPSGPVKDAQPEAIVKGFFDALPAGVQSDGFKTARRFLTGAASNWWNSDAETTVYSGAPQIARKASFADSSAANDEIAVSVRLQVQGMLDSHGVYLAVPEETETYDFTLSKVQGQWRIGKLPSGVMVGADDFKQAYRQVSLYQLGTSRKELIPDVRWLCWRDWRARAVEELLNGSAAWLRDAVVDTNTEQVTLRSNGVTVHDSTIRIRLSSVMNRMTDAERSVLVRQLRLSLGDGSKETSIDVVAGGRNYSHADDGSSLDTRSTVDPIYTLSAGNIVSLKSSNAVRVAQTGIDDADGFIFSSEGGAVLDHSGRVKRLGADGALRDTMFSGHKIRTICKGRGKEIWAVDESTEEIAVDADGRTRALTIPGLDDTQHVRAISVSPEGDRLAFSLESSKRAKSGIGIIGIRRGSDGEVESLARSFLRISDQSGVSMMTFYNDITFIYAAQYEQNDHTQIARRQLVPGPENNQSLPDAGAIAMATGEVNMYRRFAVLDRLGIVRTVDGSLGGTWSSADSQVMALSAQ